MVSMHDEIETDKDDRGLVLREERALYDRPVESVHEGNEAGVFTAAVITNPSVGIEYSFTAHFGQFWYAGYFFRI